MARTTPSRRSRELPGCQPLSATHPLLVLPFNPRGYRRVKTAADCLLSCFSINNESLNIWSHFLGALFFGYCCLRLLYDTWSWDSAFLIKDAYVPLMLADFGCFAVCAGSTFAHTFHSLSPWCHQAFFIVDYFAIGVYSICSAIAHYTYSRPSNPDVGIFSVLDTNMYIFVALCCHLWIFLMQTLLRLLFHRSWFRVHLLLSCYVAGYMVNFVSFLTRYYISQEYLPSDANHINQFFFSSFSGFLIAFHIPERLSPHRFFMLHSHSLMHILMMASMQVERASLAADVSRWDSFPAGSQPSSFTSVFTVAFFCVTAGGSGFLIVRNIDEHGKFRCRQT